ncbi:MAG: M48 family metalloprotease [Rhodocyclaceae bacterium]|nr:M48 family metalloprotease [Rhodocyclaceae bacterium]
MKRRQFIVAAGASALLAGAADLSWQAPPRFERPDIGSDEGGLWGMMDRQEARIRRSPFEVREGGLRDYVQAMACRLAGEHCPDVRVHVIHAPTFNASMAPNGMLQIYTGLLLRIENEAQLAAVLAHEIGHYLARHSLQQLREARSRSALAQFVSVFGLPGLVGNLAIVAGMYSYTREHEREADRIGLILMHQSGYAATEAARIWANLLKELEARPGGDPARDNAMFATHPNSAERQATLAALAADMPAGERGESAYLEQIKPFRLEWLHDEIRRGQHEESIALFSRMMARWPSQADVVYARGEIYRTRAGDGDLKRALEDFSAALALGGAPPVSLRSLGYTYRQLGRTAEAADALRQYLAVAPDAPDAPLIKSYIETAK